MWRKRRKKIKSPAAKQLNSRVCRLQIWTFYKMAISQPYRIQWERRKKTNNILFLLNFIFVVDSRAPRTLCKHGEGYRPFYVCARCRFRIINYSRCWKSRKLRSLCQKTAINRSIFNAVSFSSKETVAITKGAVTVNEGDCPESIMKRVAKYNWQRRNRFKFRILANSIFRETTVSISSTSLVHSYTCALCTQNLMGEQIFPFVSS